MLRRSRADWPVVLASWLLLACALGLLSAGTLYTDAVTLAGLHRELRDAPPAESSVIVRTQILPERLPTITPGARKGSGGYTPREAAEEQSP